MHDIKSIRDNPEIFDAEMHRRGLDRPIAEIAETAAKNVADRQRLDALLKRRNDLAAAVGKAKAEGSDVSDLMIEAAAVGSEIPPLETTVSEDAEWVERSLSFYPNALAPDVPPGSDETDNVQVSARGDEVAKPYEHHELGRRLGMDFEAGARLAGQRFTVLRGQMATLARALGQFMLDVHVREHGFLEVAPPVLVKRDALYGTGQFPKFEDDVFKVEGEWWLAPTSEVMLTNLVAGQLLEGAELPLRFTALTDCFRLEAGSAGRDTRGIIRQHQFQKVEMVSVVAAGEADEEQERMTSCAETILDRLGLSYRRMLLCSGDTGFSARRTYDIEVWMAGARRFREISSVSQCGDFQARRMGTRYRIDRKNKAHVHTLNGSGVAVGRALAAVLEQHQDGDGVIVPEVLRPYMGGVSELRP